MGRNKLSRLFILDPVCAQVLGHNLTSLVKFREYLKSVTNHDEIICVASKLLPSAEARKHLLKQDFGFYYLNRINILNENGSPVADASVRLPNMRRSSKRAPILTWTGFLRGIKSDSQTLYSSRVSIFAHVLPYSKSCGICHSNEPRLFF